MKTVNLTVDEKNLDTLLTILNNLKEGLIVNIQTNVTQTTKIDKPTKYKPRVNTIIREENSGTNDTNGKYINPTAFKQKLQNRR